MNNNISIICGSNWASIVIRRRRDGNVAQKGQYSIPYKSAKHTQLLLGDMRIL